MSKYICVQKSKEEFDIKGESLGQSGDIAIYYSRDIGRRRCYRQSYPVPNYKGMRLMTYKNKKNAQKLCDFTNDTFGMKFEVMEIDD